MADPKKMSVADILAAARKQGAVGSGGAEGAEPAAPIESAAPEAPAATPPAAQSPTSAAPAKPAGPMSVADILAAARANKPAAGGEAAATPAGPATPAAEKPAAKAAPAGPMSVADILAAARANKPTAAAPAAAKEKPAAKAAPKAKPAAAEGAATKTVVVDKAAPLDTSSILAAARGGAKKPGPVSKAELAKTSTVVVEPKKAKPSVPPMPEKPAYAVARPAPVTAAADDIDRRGFFDFASQLFFGSFLAVGFTTLGLTHLLWLLGLARFMFPNILTEPPSQFKVGKPDNFPMGMVENRFKAQFGVWIVHDQWDGMPQIFALKAVCTHLGCTPNWLEAEQKFKCPCHGSGFYKDGVNFEGPAPRPLERYAIYLADDGQLEVDKSRTFQEEMGGWRDAASFFPA